MSLHTHPHRGRGTFVDVRTAAISHNATVLAGLAAPAALMAVVKADGYGHGAVAAARAALDGGATWLGVALVSEGVLLREAGFEIPILVLSEQSCEALRVAAAHDLDVTVASAEGISAAIDAGRQHAAALGPLRVHLKVDTGMSRMGCQRNEAVELALALDSAEGVDLIGVFTHLACADADDLSSAHLQLDRFDEVLSSMRANGLRPAVVHAANSAAAMLLPRARFDLVRCGIATYGLDPNPSRSDRSISLVGLRPALSLLSYVSAIRDIEPGEGVSYGHRFHAERPTVIATVPLGYADGVPRALGVNGGEVIIGGTRRRIVGVVTMDQLMVDCTEGPTVCVGDCVTLIGDDGGESISADEWALAMGTINYEIVCGLSARLPRREDRSAVGSTSELAGI